MADTMRRWQKEAEKQYGQIAKHTIYDYQGQMAGWNGVFRLTDDEKVPCDCPGPASAGCKMPKKHR